MNASDMLVSFPSSLPRLPPPAFHPAPPPTPETLTPVVIPLRPSLSCIPYPACPPLSRFVSFRLCPPPLFFFDRSLASPFSVSRFHLFSFVGLFPRMSLFRLSFHLFLLSPSPPPPLSQTCSGGQDTPCRHRSHNQNNQDNTNEPTHHENKNGGGIASRPSGAALRTGTGTSARRTFFGTFLG